MRDLVDGLSLGLRLGDTLGSFLESLGLGAGCGAKLTVSTFGFGQDSGKRGGCNCLISDSCTLHGALGCVRRDPHSLRSCAKTLTLGNLAPDTLVALLRREMTTIVVGSNGVGLALLERL